MKLTTESNYAIITQEINFWQNEVEFILDKSGLTQTEFTMLVGVHELTMQNKNVTQINVCSYSGIKQMSASIILRKLQTRKLIVRKEHPIDTRAKTVVLTPAGSQTTLKLLAEIDKVNSALFQLTKND